MWAHIKSNFKTHFSRSVHTYKNYIHKMIQKNTAKANHKTLILHLHDPITEMFYVNTS